MVGAYFLFKGNSPPWARRESTDEEGERGVERQVAQSFRAVLPVLTIHSMAIPRATKERQCLALARGLLPGAELAS